MSGPTIPGVKVEILSVENGYVVEVLTPGALEKKEHHVFNRMARHGVTENGESHLVDFLCGVFGDDGI